MGPRGRVTRAGFVNVDSLRFHMRAALVLMGLCKVCGYEDGSEKAPVARERALWAVEGEAQTK